MKRVTLLTLAFVCLATLATARIEELDIEDDDRSAFHIESFGYEPGGHFELEMSNFELMVRHDQVKDNDYKYKIAFVLQQSNSDAGLVLDDGKTDPCFHESRADKKETDTIWMLSDRTNWKLFKQGKDIVVPGYYHLYFSNCETDTQVNFQLKLTEYNVDSSGKRVYLSAGEASLPTWFFILTGVFTLQAIAWVANMRKHSDNIKSIHHLMTAVVVLKILSVLFEALRYQTLKTSGLHDAWSILYYIFSFLKGMLMFGVIVLIGTGWSYLKPFLTEKDKQIMLIVLVVQALVNIAMVVVDETTPGASDWLTWRDILHLLDMLCCIIILLPIVWSIRHLRQAAGEDNKDGRAARSAERLTRFRSFYLLVVTYVYFTRIIVFLLGATLPFELTWLGYMFSEGANVLFYGYTGYLFRPQSKNPYLPLDTEDPDAHGVTELPPL